jgi:hypothetical protein
MLAATPRKYTVAQLVGFIKGERRAMSFEAHDVQSEKW